MASLFFLSLRLSYGEAFPLALPQSACCRGGGGVASRAGPRTHDGVGRGLERDWQEKGGHRCFPRMRMEVFDNEDQKTIDEEEKFSSSFQW